MKPPPFDYHAPRGLAEALELLTTCDNAKLLAGGQSLMPMLNMRFVQPDHVIDLNRMDELAYLREEPGRIVIGAMARQRDLERSPLIASRLPLMEEALRHVGHIQTRNRGTIGGSLCHLDPSAELPAVAMALDAEIEIASPRGRRAIPMREFHTGYMSPGIEFDEIVTEIRIPFRTGRGAGAFEEFARRHGDFAVVAVAVQFDADTDRRITHASVTVAGATATPSRIVDAERMLIGERPEPSLLAAASECCGAIDATDDPYASKDYRCHLASVLGLRALQRATLRLGGDVGAKVA